MIRTSQRPFPDILIDSSIWVDFYRPESPKGIRDAVTEALALDSVFTVPLIAAEVVQGAPDEPTLEALLDDFSALRQIPIDQEVGAAAARIGYALRRRGRPTPATDLVIAAAALRADCELWHRDAHFEAVAGVAPLRARAF